MITDTPEERHGMPKSKIRKDSAMLEKYTEPLPVKLTDAELLELGQSLAKLEGDLAKLAAQDSALRLELKTKRTELEAEQRRLAETILARAEEREVEVEQWARYREGTVESIRTDTGEVVGTRPLAPNERQADLWGAA